MGISVSAIRELRLRSDVLCAARRQMSRGRSAMCWRLETLIASLLMMRSMQLSSNAFRCLVRISIDPLRVAVGTGAGEILVTCLATLVTEELGRRRTAGQ